MEFSPKQLSFIKHSDAFENIAHGPVRSGKTHGNLYRLCDMAITGPPGDLVIVGKTERTAKRNIIYPLQDLNPGAVDYKEGSGELHLFGRRCYVVGANDARAENKIRGMTLAGGYVNEWTLVPEEFTNQLYDRCSVDGAQLLGDTNPDGPFHYLKKTMDRLSAPDLKSWGFVLNDNPVLSSEYKERLSRIHAPGSLWHRRMVLGEWVVAEGSIYDMFEAERHVVSWRDLHGWGKDSPPAWQKLFTGADYGTANPTAFLALGLYKGRWVAFAENRHEGQAAGSQRTDSEHSAAYRSWLEGLNGAPRSHEIDPSAASFKEQLRRDGVRSIRDADNEVIDGIRTVASALTGGRLLIHESCEKLIEEFGTYVWDQKAQERGEDKPVKENDHSLDILRYLVMRAIGRVPVAVIDKPVGF